MKYSELPLEERPVSRLEKHGAEALSNAELLSLMLGLSDSDEAHGVLAASGGVASLAGMSKRELAYSAGLSDRQATVFVAAAAFMSRVRESRVLAEEIHGPRQVAEMFFDRARTARQESMYSLSLDAAGHIIGIHEAAKGSGNSAFFDPADIFRQAIKDGAARLILVHNHPSGLPGPSQDDLAATQRVQQVGELIGIPLVDHVIVGDERYTSLKNTNPYLFETGVEASLANETDMPPNPVSRTEPVGLVRSKERGLRGEYAAAGAARGLTQDAGHEV